MINKTRATAALITAASLTALGVSISLPGEAAVSTVCAALNDPVYNLVKNNTLSLATPSKSEADKATATYGFNENQGEIFQASVAKATGLVPVHRMYRKSKQDFLLTSNPAEWTSAAKAGYTDQGVSFYASTKTSSCMIPIGRYFKASVHRLAVADADRKALVAAGWKSEGTAFYGVAASASTTPPSTTPPTTPPTTDPTPPVDPNSSTTFSFAVMPDTQQEVLNPKDTRFINRTQWLVKEKTALNLKFVTHTGDVNNWDTADHSQYVVSSNAMKPLQAAGIPYSLAIGNHDSNATGPGGSARPGGNTRAKQRDTSTFNSYFNAKNYGGESGAFEKNKVDNVYSLYNAGGKKFMVLVLEMWPRASVVNWAKTVVASHPDYNVIISTHDYLSSKGALETAAGYGDTTPANLFKELVSQYANIKMVVSGHVGFAASRVDTGVHGNKIYDFMTTIHSTTTNPTRMFTIDTKAGTIKTWIYCPSKDLTYTQYSETVKSVAFVS
jgi:hypothetical protein